ncbi:hypothetical protein U91I_02789 [alpha proteobacterium U9-1i]|nr:hypothetical protein U91I_02789 [alpha proteobacterium U9-1i]
MKSYVDGLIDSELPRAVENVGVKMLHVTTHAQQVGALGGSRVFIDYQTAIVKGIEEYGGLLRQRLAQFDPAHAPLNDADFDKAEASIDKLRHEALALYEKKCENQKAFGGSGLPFEEARLTAAVDSARNEIAGLHASFRSQRPGSDEWVSAAAALEILEPSFSVYTAAKTICERAHHGLIQARADVYREGNAGPLKDCDVPPDFWWAEGEVALEQNWGAGDFSTWTPNSYNRIELKAFGVKFRRADIEKVLPLRANAKPSASILNDEDKEVIKRLTPLVQSAALSYEQAMRDLADDNRISFRGPALELREALREVLDNLAPDAEVMAAPGYKPEKDESGKDRTKPTMAQKARFMMQKKHSSPAAEQAISAFDGAIAKLTRAVYTLSSQATHVAQERDSVRQIRRYVVVLLHEMLPP